MTKLVMRLSVVVLVATLLLVVAFGLPGAPTASAQTAAAPSPVVTATVTTTPITATVTPTTTVAVTTCIVTAQSLNVRADADAAAKATGKLSKGTVITVLEEADGWVRHSKGWSSSQYLDCSATTTVTATVAVTATKTVTASAVTATAAPAKATTAPTVATALSTPTPTLLPIVQTAVPDPPAGLGFTEQWLRGVAAANDVAAFHAATDVAYEAGRWAAVTLGGCFDVPVLAGSYGQMDAGASTGEIEVLNDWFRLVQPGSRLCGTVQAFELDR